MSFLKGKSQWSHLKLLSVCRGETTGSVVNECDDDITEAGYDDAEVAGVPRDSGSAVMAKSFRTFYKVFFFLFVCFL